jgi:hypothetical protein
LLLRLPELLDPLLRPVPPSSALLSVSRLLDPLLPMLVLPLLPLASRLAELPLPCWPRELPIWLC